MDLNEGLHKIHQLRASTAAATGALSGETRDRMENAPSYLDKAMQILELVNMSVGHGSDKFRSTSTFKSRYCCFLATRPNLCRSGHVNIFSMELGTFLLSARRVELEVHSDDDR